MYSLRSTNEFIIPNISRYYDTFCIGYKGHLIWNSLYINIKNTNPLKKFLNVLKNKLLVTIKVITMVTINLFIYVIYTYF